MNERIRELIAEIHEREEELRRALREHEERVLDRLHETQAGLEASVRERHRRLKTGLLRWFADSRPQSLLSVPFIYAMIVPLLLLDAFVSVYAAICFPLYRIAIPRRADYIAMDRERLEYLNFMERLHCAYCAYANGLLAWSLEIAARTEQYWCPIKHARRMQGTHSRYARFLDYGDAEHFQQGLRRLREELDAERESGG